jgi:hypothetical protein
MQKMQKPARIPKSVHGILIFFIFILIFSFVQPQFAKYDAIPLGTQQYIATDAANLRDRPESYEGKLVSSGSDFVLFVQDANTNESFFRLKADILLKVNASDPSIQYITEKAQPGNYISFRGICYLSSKGYIEIIEVHLQSNDDRLVVYGFSGFGFFGFLILFFNFYKIDLKQLKIMPKISLQLKEEVT